MTTRGAKLHRPTKSKKFFVAGEIRIVFGVFRDADSESGISFAASALVLEIQVMAYIGKFVLNRSYKI